MSIAQKGTVLIYGSVGGKTTGPSGLREKTGYLYPGAGYQFSDAWTAGLEYGLQSTKIEGKVISRHHEFGPFIQYFHPLSDMWGVFATGGAGMVYARAEDITSRGFYARVFPAVYLSVNNLFGIYFLPGNVTFTRLDKINTIDFNFGLAPIIGISKNIALHKSKANPSPTQE